MTIINFGGGISGDLSDYALKTDQEKDVIGGTTGTDTIVLNHRDGTKTSLPIGDAIEDAVSGVISKMQASDTDIDSLF